MIIHLNLSRSPPWPALFLPLHIMNDRHRRGCPALEGSLNNTSRQLPPLKRDAEVVVVDPEDGQAFKWSGIILDADFFELVGLVCMTDAHTASFPGFFGFPEGIEAAAAIRRWLLVVIRRRNTKRRSDCRGRHLGSKPYAR